MIESDLELVEKQAVAKAWLAKIENQGIAEFSDADSLDCDLPLNFGLIGFTFIAIKHPGKVGEQGVVSSFLRSHDTGNNRLSVSDRYGASKDMTVSVVNDSGVSSSHRRPTPTNDEDIYIIAAVFPRDGTCDLYFYNITSSTDLWGYIYQFTGLNDSGVDIGSGNLTTARFNEIHTGSNYSQLAFPDLCVNRAMTSEEIHAYVSGIGSPNSLPEDLRGVGSLGVTPPNATSSGAESFTDASPTGFSANNTSSTMLAGWILPSVIKAGTTVKVTATISNYTGAVESIKFRSGSDLAGVVASNSIEISADGAMEFDFILTEDADTLSIYSWNISSYTISDLHIQPLGQIFSCRPHRDGIHTDDTGNGYNWNSVNSPVIKPFSAGIR